MSAFKPMIVRNLSIQENGNIQNENSRLSNEDESEKKDYIDPDFANIGFVSVPPNGIQF